jgi:hypothetical protein
MRQRAAGRNARAQAERERRIGTGSSGARWTRARWPARDADLGALAEIFFMSGVVSLLLTRFYLALTGFPQLGGAGSGLHIAHLLWGGLLMLVALVLLLAFLGRSMQRAAALLGGIGFGLLLDEVGKFVTSSNDYFFQPAVAIMYIVFACLFLAFRMIERGGRFTPRELLANAYDEAVEVVLRPEHAAHRARALHLLRASGATGPLARALHEALTELDALEPARVARESRRERAGRALTRAYLRAARSRWFPRAIVLLVVAYAFVFLLLFGLALAAAVVSAADVGPAFALDLFALRGHRIIQAGLLVSSLAATALVVRGLLVLPHARQRAYRWFKLGTLVSLLFGQVFLFYTQQFGALVELALNLLVLASLDALLAAEERAQRLAEWREGVATVETAPSAEISPASRSNAPSPS